VRRSGRVVAKPLPWDYFRVASDPKTSCCCAAARLDDRAEKTRRDYCTVTATLAVWDSGGVVLVAVTAMV
jgi:hypothetical protein